jgi:hypothetical protein
MSAVPKPQRVWTPEQRLNQSCKLRERQIWLKSNGPRTVDGKSISSCNARHNDYKHRMAQREKMRHIKAYLRTQKTYIDLIRLFSKHEESMGSEWQQMIESDLFFLENELIDLERKIFEGLRFHEIIGIENRNIIPFPSGNVQKSEMTW